MNDFVKRLGGLDCCAVMGIPYEHMLSKRKDFT